LTNGRRSRCASRKTGAVARSIVLFWTLTMSNSKGAPFTRAKSRRAHARKFGSIGATRSRECGQASARSGHVGRVVWSSVTGPSGPSCLCGGGLGPAAG
jgi:hypothetical protein